MHNINETINLSTYMHILYIEDNREVRETTMCIFEEFFSKIIVAIYGEDGYKKFKDNKIVSNVDALEMIQTIKDLNLNIPVIILSTHIKSEYFLKSIKSNAKGYLIKTLDIGSLFKILDDMILSVKLQKEIEEKNKKITQDHKFLHSIINNFYDSIMVIQEMSIWMEN